MKAVRKEIMPWVTLTCVQTDKFKTNCLSINLLTQLRRETASLNALVPSVLRRGSEGFPDMESVAKHLGGLYGASLEPYVRKKGEIQAVGFGANFIDDKYAPGGEKLLERIGEMMGEILLSPVTRGGLLLEEYVTSERDKLIEKLDARINEKRSYSMQRLFELMCFSEDYAVDRNGSPETAEQIDSQSLTHRYNELLQQSPIEIFYCGSSDFERVGGAMLKALNLLPRGEMALELGTDIRMNSVEDKPRYYSEEMDVTQGKLAIGFRLGRCMEEPNPAAIKVMNAVFGGSVTSKLFMNVREKLSLAYFASSLADVNKGIMAVSSGIEFENFEKARDEIFLQLDAVKNGDVTDDELLWGSRYLASVYRSCMDDPDMLEDFYLSQNIAGESFGPEEFADMCEAVTKDEVVNIAKGIECDAVYFLKGLTKGGANE